MKGGHTPIHIQRWAPADLHSDEHWKLLVARRDYRTMHFYRVFMDHAFMAGGDLPADSTALAAVLNMPRRDVVDALKFCVGKLVFQDGERLYQKRVRREVKGELKYRRSKSRAGKESAKQRWGDDESVPGTRAQRLAAARKLGTHTDEEWEALVEFTGRRCLACKTHQEALAGGALTRDHIVMISKGGSDGIENIQPLCRNCNTRSAKDKKDFRLEIPGFAEWFARVMPNRRLTVMPNPPAPAPAPCAGAVRRTPSPTPAPTPPPAPTPTPTPDIPNGAAARAGGVRSNSSPPAPPASAAPWVIDHDASNPLEARVASRIAHLASLVAEREGSADALEILAAVSVTPEEKVLDHVRGAPERWLETTLAACDAFERDLT